MNIGFAGLGKLGASVASCIAAKGHNVKSKIPVKELVQHSEIIFVPIKTPYEEKYEGLLKLKDIKAQEVVFSASRPIDEEAKFDYGFLKAVIDALCKEIQHQQKHTTVILLSTVMPGMIEREILPLLNEYVHFCYCPFDATIQEFTGPEFVLFGGDDDETLKQVEEFYATIHDRPVLHGSIHDTEWNKLLFNTHKLLPGETCKARDRRNQEGWFEKYAPADKSGIDIGCRFDRLHPQFRGYDFLNGDGDATFMADVEDATYHTVYASHILEHLDDPITALKNWWRILEPGGHLIVMVPHRDIYEQKKTLPSQWNEFHKSFWLPDKGDNDCTFGLRETVQRVIPNGKVVYLAIHSEGEYSIEIILQKLDLTKKSL
jgi:hypothetical protein